MKSFVHLSGALLLAAAFTAASAQVAETASTQSTGTQSTGTQTATTQYQQPGAQQPMASVTTTTVTTTTAAPAATAPTATTTTATPAVAAAPAGPRVRFKTTMGDIVIELNKELAPKTTRTILHYVTSGHYKGTVFHRVIDGFMIQAGGYDKDLKDKHAPRKVENEAKNGLKNDKYTVAMARPNDPHGASSQFFINVENNNKLDYPGRDGWGYAVFGKVVEGFETVDAIRKVPVTEKGMHQHAPVTPVVITSAQLLK